MKKALSITAALLLAMLLAAGCAMNGTKRYSVTDLTLFDTVTTVTGYAASQAAFDEAVRPIFAELSDYNKLYDIYHTYDGINNLKTVNDAAGGAPVAVDGRIIALLQFGRELYTLTDGQVNILYGSVLSLWHDARTEALDDPAHAKLPDEAALAEAAKHTDIGGLVIDEENGTVRLTDPLSRIDVGAIAKGFAAEQVKRNAPEGLLINVGGNICVTGANPGTGKPWNIGVQNPTDGGQTILHTVAVSAGAVVSSGDYQRTFTVNGVDYHHIIDPTTGYPAARWRGVTVVCDDSGIADGLSTALFLLDRSAGEALLRRYDAEACWVDTSGAVQLSAGYAEGIASF